MKAGWKRMKALVRQNLPEAQSLVVISIVVVIGTAGSWLGHHGTSIVPASSFGTAGEWFAGTATAAVIYTAFKSRQRAITDELFGLASQLGAIADRWDPLLGRLPDIDSCTADMTQIAISLRQRGLSAQCTALDELVGRIISITKTPEGRPNKFNVPSHFSNTKQADWANWVRPAINDIIISVKTQSAEPNRDHLMKVVASMTDQEIANLHERWAPFNDHSAANAREYLKGDQNFLHQFTREDMVKLCKSLPFDILSDLKDPDLNQLDALEDPTDTRAYDAAMRLAQGLSEIYKKRAKSYY